jgi:hypothetical protein
VAYLLRKKVFIDSMCQQVNDKLPIKELHALCNEQVTLAESLIFKDSSMHSSSQSFEAINQLQHGVIVNLVYDPDLC